MDDRAEGAALLLNYYYYYYCYRVQGVNNGVNQEACDEAFLANMKSVCQNARWRRAVHKRWFISDIVDSIIDLMPNKEEACESVAYVYYGSVRAAGHLHYEDPSLDYCSKSYIPSCLP